METYDREAITEHPEPADSLLDALATPPTGGLIARGTLVDGLYRIERVIGEGGMGVVYRAHDVRLQRSVALKLGRSASAAACLAREARALARLSHPNIVVIHQVGELDGRPYVAMEYVDGGTARAWCRAPRSWAEIVALYAAAGEGLAAAHAAGVIHRDVKPDNVLVGGDGRPRLADFGLASVSGGDDDAAGRGTPAYMAPEQAAGERVDARADQYALCASLWEALFGIRHVATPGAIDGAARASLTRHVPRHVEAALRRGLRRDPEARWPTLTALVAGLRGAARPAPRAWATGALALGLATALALVSSGAGR